MNGLSQMQMVEKYNCEKCRFFTKDPNKYNIHIALHNEMKYVCSHCNFESYTKTEFQRHLVSHTGKFPYTCGYCGYGAIRNDYIVKHIKRIHGDGKILCSVSTIENESKNASVNIVQTQVRTSLQELLPNNTAVVAKSSIDFTNEMGNSIFNGNNVHINGNGNSSNDDQVEVEVISPINQQLNPWTPLAVVAPTSFKVPENCLAEVVEVKPINGSCHLVLKCSAVIDSHVPNEDFSKENLCENNMLGLLELKDNYFETLDGSTQDYTQLNGTGTPLHALGTVTLTAESPSNAQASPLNEMDGSNSPMEASNEFLDETEELCDLPVISSVFSLSSYSENVIEGIQWESPVTVTNTNLVTDGVEIASTRGSEPKIPETDANFLGVIDKSNEHKIALERDFSETDVGEVKDMYPKTDLPFSKPALPSDRKPESQISAFAQIKRVKRKSNRLSKVETFTKPQTLFLSCNKSIVMQPLSCLMQSVPKTEQSKEDDNVPCKKTKPPRAKPTSKIVHKRLTAPSSKTLRLYPVKSDQLTLLPHKNQPVVVLNHPELESLETFCIMTTIGMFRGKVLKVSLSK